MENKRYVYINTKTNAEYLSYTDIANEFGVGKGVVAGRFYRASKKAGPNEITLKGNKIKRVQVVLEPKPIRKYSKRNATIYVPSLEWLKK